MNLLARLKFIYIDLLLFIFRSHIIIFFRADKLLNILKHDESNSNCSRQIAKLFLINNNDLSLSENRSFCARLFIVSDSKRFNYDRQNDVAILNVHSLKSEKR